MVRRAQAVFAAFAMAAVILTPHPARSQTAAPPAIAAGKTYEVFLFDSSQVPIRECLTFEAGGNFNAGQFGSGTWQAIPFVSGAFWWAITSEPGISSSELIGFAFPQTAAMLSGMARRTVVDTGEELQFGLFGFANPNCN
jgi:hypothetical protein